MSSLYESSNLQQKFIESIFAHFYTNILCSHLTTISLLILESGLELYIIRNSANSYGNPLESLSNTLTGLLANLMAIWMLTFVLQWFLVKLGNGIMINVQEETNEQCVRCLYNKKEIRKPTMDDNGQMFFFKSEFFHFIFTEIMFQFE